jgi:selenocysteine-specific elongation factor
VTAVHVIATAGHVDHGKSTLLRALTGTDPDRWEEEQRRGLTIDLGFAWLSLPTGEQLAFVDVPGHERFVPNMMAGVGPVPAVLFVVAADEGWKPQSAEHLAVLDALGIRHGLLVITRSDLAEPGQARSEAAKHLARSSLGELPAVAVSSVTGEGMSELVSALGCLASSLPQPDPGAPVRLWVDRAFSITGSGTVVTGTLQAGTVHVGDELLVTPAMQPVRVRAIQSLGADAHEVSGVARVALNLRGISRDKLGRGMALIHPGRWTMTDTLDVRLTAQHPAADGQQPPPVPRMLTLHAGSARTLTKVRPLAPGLARLTLRDPLPLHVSDRVLLRDPGAATADQRQVLGAVVLDVSPPALARRGAAAAAAREISRWPDRPAAADLLRRHGLLRASTLLAMGVSEHPDPVTGEWLLDPGHRAVLSARVGEAVAAHSRQQPLARGLPVDAVRGMLGLPDRRLVEALVRQPLEVRDGMVVSAEPPAGDAAASLLLGAVESAVAQLRADLEKAPFVAPDAERLRQLRLDRRAIAAAARAGLLLRISDQVVLAPGADEAAAEILAGLPQPFTAADARQALSTTRRIAIPLLEYLDRAGVTERLPDDRRTLRR